MDGPEVDLAISVSTRGGSRQLAPAVAGVVPSETSATLSLQPTPRPGVNAQ